MNDKILYAGRESLEFVAKDDAFWRDVFVELGAIPMDAIKNWDARVLS